MRAAMAESRAARQAFDEAIQGVFANAAAKMSPEGRHALGNWRNSSKKRSNSRSDSTRQ
jgi:ribulose 1,5-bisphosphate carboxylase large subunit-like protein